MKYFLIIFASVFFSAGVMAQDTTVVYINNKKAAQAVIKPGETAALLQINKSDYKRSGSCIIKISGEHIDGELYKRSLEITGPGSIIIDETKNKPGHFDISGTDSKKQLLAGKSIALYLIMDPSNPRMKIPSKRIYLGNLMMK